MAEDVQFCPVGGERFLSTGEIALARSMFGDAIDYAKVTIRRRKWFPLQPFTLRAATTVTISPARRCT